MSQVGELIKVYKICPVIWPGTFKKTVHETCWKHLLTRSIQSHAHAAVIIKTSTKMWVDFIPSCSVSHILPMEVFLSTRKRLPLGYKLRPYIHLIDEKGHAKFSSIYINFSSNHPGRQTVFPCSVSQAALSLVFLTIFIHYSYQSWTYPTIGALAYREYYFSC